MRDILRNILQKYNAIMLDPSQKFRHGITAYTTRKLLTLNRIDVLYHFV